MSIPWGDVLQTQHLLKSHFSNVEVWDRDYGNYRASDFGNANIVVFMLPENNFSYSTGHLPVGVYKELKESLDNGKQMYIAYTTKMDNKLCIYEARVNGSLFEGISGTAGNIFAKHTSKPITSLQDVFETAAERISINSRYGVATLETIDKTWTTDQGVTHRIHTQNPCEEAASPLYLGKKKYVHTIVWKDYDERLLLMM